MMSYSVGGEESSAVAVGVVVDELDGLVERVHGHGDQRRAEYLLFVARHVCLVA